jgi:hypothetical protein
MLKSNHLKKVESLIELKKQFRVITGVVESIGETIRLWHKCDKLDEYWDNCWSRQSEELESCIANLYAYVDQLRLIAGWRWLWSSPETMSHYFQQRQAICTSEMFRSTKPFQHKLLKLQRTADSAALEAINAVEGRWRTWMRKQSMIPAARFRDATVRLLILKLELEKCWRFIQMPLLSSNSTPDSVVN